MRTQSTSTWKWWGRTGTLSSSRSRSTPLSRNSWPLTASGQDWLYRWLLEDINLYWHVYIQTIRFSFDGTRINESDTPKSLDMEDGDTIEVFQQQSGGCTWTEPPEHFQTLKLSNLWSWDLCLVCDGLMYDVVARYCKFKQCRCQCRYQLLHVIQEDAWHYIYFIN